MARRRGLDAQRGASSGKIACARELRLAMTPAEQRLWEVLQGDALGVRVRRQHVTRGWIVDFYLPAARLIIEVDGAVHDPQHDDDQRRTEALEAEGLRVIRFDNDAIFHALPKVVATIVDALERAAR